MIIYQISQFDDWRGWRKPNDLFREMEKQGPTFSTEYRDHAEWDRQWSAIQRLAPKAGWEGDVREGPFVTVVPGADSGESPILVGFKQDTNGTTFIASPYRLPWLEAAGVEWIDG